MANWSRYRVYCPMAFVHSDSIMPCQFPASTGFILLSCRRVVFVFVLARAVSGGNIPPE